MKFEPLSPADIAALGLFPPTTPAEARKIARTARAWRQALMTVAYFSVALAGAWIGVVGL